MSTKLLAEPLRAWHALDGAEAISVLGTEPAGLTPEETARRIDEFGPNRLPPGLRRSALLRFFARFHNLLIYVLLGAGTLAAAIGHITDALVILAVVIVNAVIGFV